MKLSPDTALLFWGGPCSQWSRHPILIDGTIYNCNEQFMMAEKATLFGDLDACSAIMATKEPANQKAIGRRVNRFDHSEWQKIARVVVYRANLAKFSQHADLGQWLMNTGDKVIVEASPEDSIWGIGLHESDNAAWDTETWRGLNWLGIAIMQVRADLRTMRQFNWRQHQGH